MTVAQLIAALESLDAPEAEIKLITTDYRTIQSDLVNVSLQLLCKQGRVVYLSDDQ